MTRYVNPKEVVALAESAGVRLAVPTLATWRSIDPERLPFRRIAGRVYYERVMVEKFLNGDQVEAIGR